MNFEISSGSGLRPRWPKFRLVILIMIFGVKIQTPILLILAHCILTIFARKICKLSKFLDIQNSRALGTSLKILFLFSLFFKYMCTYSLFLSTFYKCIFYTHSYNLNWLWSSSFVILPNVSSFSFKRLKILAICCCCTL